MIKILMALSLAMPTPLMMPDKQAWPGDQLSEKQVASAIEQFAAASPWEWVLIGPGDWLLAGTSYRVVNRNDAEVPNIAVVHGYFGGNPYLSRSVDECKKIAEQRAKDDLESGIKP